MHHRCKAFLYIGILFLLTVVLALSCIALIEDGLSEQAHTAELQYDYTDLQYQISIAPFHTVDPPRYDAAALRSENPDFRGWLFIPNTNISFPVVQGADNSYYLNHSFQKKKSAYGCPFLEYTATATDRNLVIHGHNMGINREEMFSSLVYFQEQEFADAHTRIFYSDPNKPGLEAYRLFAVLNLNIHNTDGFQYRQQQFPDDAAFQEYISYLKAHSLYLSEYTPTGDLLILSTCNRAYGNDNRLLICAGRER